MLSDYLLKLLGKSDFDRLSQALEDGKTIIVSGAYGSGKTTLVNILKKSGYQAVEDFETHQVALKKPLDSKIPTMEDTVLTSSTPEMIFRRFIPVGTAEEMDKLHSLIEEKDLSREDLILILRAIKLNQREKHDLAVIREELQNIRSILEFAHVPKYTVKIVDGKHIRVPFDRSKVFSPSEAEQG